MISNNNIIDTEKITTYIIVDNKKILGRFSITGETDRSFTPPKFTVTGLIETPEVLDDSYEEMSGGRIIVRNIMIDSENLGSESNNIVYGFSAKGYQILSTQD